MIEGSASGAVISILQPLFLPWVGMFNLLSRSDVFVFLDNVQFVRQSWQQRNRIKTSQGVLWLTIPVRHRFGQEILEVKIDYGSNFVEKHLRTITQSYQKAAFFGDFFPVIERLYRQKFEKLTDLSSQLVLAICSYLGVKTKVLFSHSLPIENRGGQDYVLGICQYLGAKKYLNGPLGRKFYDSGKFHERGVELIFHDYQHPVYPQLYGEFISHLSVIDLLFNCGPKSLQIINSGYGQN